MSKRKAEEPAVCKIIATGGCTSSRRRCKCGKHDVFEAVWDAEYTPSKLPASFELTPDKYARVLQHAKRVEARAAKVEADRLAAYRQIVVGIRGIDQGPEHTTHAYVMSVINEMASDRLRQGDNERKFKEIDNQRRRALQMLQRAEKRCEGAVGELEACATALEHLSAENARLRERLQQGTPSSSAGSTTSADGRTPHKTTVARVFRRVVIALGHTREAVRHSHPDKSACAHCAEAAKAMTQARSTLNEAKRLCKKR